MDKYYHFLNRIVDIQTSDKNELVEITDDANNGLRVDIHKLSKERKVKELLFSKSFDPSVTKEIRLFVVKGNDSISLNTGNGSIKLRIIGGKRDKIYQVIKAKGPIKVYDKKDAVFTGDRINLADDYLMTLSIHQFNKLIYIILKAR